MNPSERRSQIRFDVVGALWGQLELDEPARIRNVSTTGVLLDSSVPAALQSEQVVRVLIEGQQVTVNTLVRRLHPITDNGNPKRYLVGLEFESPPISVIQSIEQLNSNA